MAVITLVERILEVAERSPTRPAIIVEGRPISYLQLAALAHVAARRMHDAGVRPGETVAVAMGHTPVHAIVLVALARLGAVALSLFPTLPAAHRTRAAKRYGASKVVTDALGAVPPGLPVIEMTDLQARDTNRDFGFAGFVPTPDASLRIGLTSGTTGDQKAFLHTHGDFTRRVERRFRGEDAVPRAIPPLLHITSGLQLAWHTLAAAGTLVFPSPRDAHGLLAAIHLYGVTHVNLPPVDLAALLTLIPDDAPAFPSLRRVNVIGATPPPALVRLAQRKFSPHLIASYSMSEVGMVATADMAALQEAPGSVGRVAAGAQVEVLSDDGRVLGPGERGEIRVKVEGMPSGYFGPDAALPGFRDGWFHPGDHGYLSPEGFLFVEGRNDSQFNVGGHKVAPEYIEALLCSHPSIEDAAVYAVADEMTGSRVVAAVVPKAGFDPASVAAFAREALGWSAPSSYVKVASLPRNPMGRIDRHDLREWCESRGDPVTAG